ncbi:MAG TPA: bifunctional response regulator/alkaline phosphatase family protein [Bacteroidia bacterium]|jgi:DNA-binding response OmpR family regulator|nr:bifunctional response regulator/alkaline phosphatase family protein [Bacteroidia bacterium]
MDKIQILWADDEIELLKPHVLFLKEKGYDVQTAISGDGALDLMKKTNFDIVFLDENMPGLSGMETLARIKGLKSDLPVVMITKSEEERIMEDAIGSKISDYLIKPVNPNQILLSLKKILDNKRLVSEKTTSGYQQEFRSIGMTLSDRLSHTEWVEVYKKLVYWELELQKSSDQSMFEVLQMQKREANAQFGKFIENNYISWLNGKEKNPPVLSHTLFKNKVVPALEQEGPVFLILIDNLRYDQWKMLQPILHTYFKTESEDLFFSILPTATQYARNALFAGLLPSEIEKMFPNQWLNDEEEGGKNQFEDVFLAANLKRLGKDIKHSYNKITNHAAGKKLSENFNNLMGNKLNVIVYNFVDMLSHARTEMEVIRELADDEAAYRSITVSWFEHSPLHDIIKQIAEKKGKLIITTDHGTIKVTEPSKVVGDKNVNTNLRYKQGKSLDYVKRDVFEVRKPEEAYLPKQHVSQAFIFIKEDKFFAYPNNYNYYVSYYRNTFQHGGISLEEMIIPYIVMSAR